MPATATACWGSVASSGITDAATSGVSAESGPTTMMRDGPAMA